MDPKTLDDRLAVSPQIALEDLPELKRRGYGSVISNRPDGEVEDQPSFHEIARAAKAAGLEARHIPVVPGQVGDGEAQAFSDALDELPGPTLAFCRSGQRSASLWALNEAERRPTGEVLETTRAAGYDLSGLAERLRARGPES